MSYIHYDAIKQLANQLDGKDATLFAPFIEGYYALAADEDLQDFSPEGLFSTAKTHFDSAKTFSGQPIVNVFIPNQAEHGYQGEYSVMDVTTLDRPFLIDSLLMLLTKRNIEINFVAHPLFEYQSDADGLNVLAQAKSSTEEGLSAIHIEFNKLPEAELDAIKQDVHALLTKIDRVVVDWRPMTTKMNEVLTEIDAAQNLPQSAEEVADIKTFLKWLADGHFTFLGYREYEVKDGAFYNVANSGLGVLQNPDHGAISASFTALPDSLKPKTLLPELLFFSKSNQFSDIHRPAYMDFISVKRFDDNGQVIGEHRFLGLLTEAAYTLPASHIPYLGGKFPQVKQKLDFPVDSYASKTLDHILSEFPRDEIFQADTDFIADMALGVYHLRERHQLRFFARVDRFETYVSCFVYVPRDRFDSALRAKMQDYLTQKFNGTTSTFTTSFGEGIHARVNCLVRTQPGNVPEIDREAIEQALTEMARNRQDSVSKLLNQEFGETEGNTLLNRFEKTAPVAYKNDCGMGEAVEDYKALDALSQSEQADAIALNLYDEDMADRRSMRMKLYGLKERANLSAVLPILERFGFIVKSARPYQFKQDDQDVAWVVDFSLGLEKDYTHDLADIRARFNDAFLAVWHGEAENDDLNRQVIFNGAKWRDAMVLRAIGKYLIQAKAPYSTDYIQSTLNNHPQITIELLKLFNARLNPNDVPERDNLQTTIIAGLGEQLATVSVLDEDRILRRFIDVLKAMLRTNFWRTDKNGQHRAYLSFKLDSQAIPDLPLPKPMFEIFVYSPFVEGIHLRGGKVARGGLRWSDRREDFRTEVLGLVKAQIVKNAVIVPVGSKGGFFVKQPRTESREAWMEEGIRCYKMFISGLLDVTDNIVNGEIVAPEHVYRQDPADPYLVVAADKGTATFSDIANGVAAEYGFWLDDAFASGGSVGYDHKGMGITARGAWESVKRHFRHLGKNIQTTDFTVIGIGDMGGDVFGNGMLLSEHIRLQAAFNHMHIFLDPNPNSADSYVERKRLFETPRTTWDDYDKSLISEGGGVFSRSDKSITLTPQVKAAFDIEEDELSPNQLINRLLKAPVELLWNGGIGTYVKATEESHADVGDRANDVLRVNGNELRCKVIGEGGNLGFTQLGRIEFAQHGGLVLTDAIDNSAGVNCSDHEVNIKILLNQVVERGDLTVAQRNDLLASMTDEVGRLVLRQNYQQPQAVKIAERDPDFIVNHAELIDGLEKEGRLDREIEFLPNNEEIARRIDAGEGLTAPEIAVLLAYTKIKIFDELLASDIPEQPFFQADLTHYFPKPLREKYVDDMQSHRLHREIVATFLTNSLVNHMGTIFVQRTAEETGQSVPQIVLAYVAARDIFSARKYWNSIDALDNEINADLQNELHLKVRQLLDRASNWFLMNRRDNINIEHLRNEFSNIPEVVAHLPEVMPNTVAGLADEVDELIGAGVPEDLAKELTYLPHAIYALDMIDLSGDKHDFKAVSQLYFDVFKLTDAPWLRRHILALMGSDLWLRRSAKSLMQSLMVNVNTISRSVLEQGGDPSIALADWASTRQSQLNGYQELMTEVKADNQGRLAPLSVAVGELSELARS